MFKLNPGLTGDRIPVIVSKRRNHQHKAQLTRPSRNPRNLININCSTRFSLNGYHNYPNDIMYIQNARSVKNENADILGYICDCKADLFAITETWLAADDVAVWMELCPDGYKGLDIVAAKHAGLVYRS